MNEPENIKQKKQVLEVALLTSTQPLSLDDMQKLFADRIERATLRMLLDELKQDWEQRVIVFRHELNIPFF
jgi:segregation and condensation protein B